MIGVQHLCRAVRAIWASRDLPGLVLLVAAAATCLIGAALLFSPSLERFLIARHQLDAGFVGHAVLAPYPSMYSFSHRRYISVHGFPPDLASGWPHRNDRVESVCTSPGGFYEPINHFPGPWMHRAVDIMVACDTDTVFVEIRSEGQFVQRKHRVRLSRTGSGVDWQVVR